MRQWIAATLTVLAIICHVVAASAAPTEPRNAITTFEDRARAYVDTVNAGDADAVDRFRANDTSDAFNASIPAPAFRAFFRNQHRVTGGLDLVEIRARTGTAQIADILVRDHIYGQLHGVELTLDGTAKNRLSDFELADATPAWAISRQGAPARAEVAERSRDMVRLGCSAGVFSGAALVAWRGRILMQDACGEANLRYHAKNDVDTRFNLGSMNKMFTAVAIMQLVEAGKLSLNDRLSK